VNLPQAIVCSNFITSSANLAGRRFFLVLITGFPPFVLLLPDVPELALPCVQALTKVSTLFYLTGLLGILMSFMLISFISFVGLFCCTFEDSLVPTIA